MIAYTASEIDLLLNQSSDTFDLIRVANYLNWHKRSYTKEQLMGWNRAIIKLMGVFEKAGL